MYKYILGIWDGHDAGAALIHGNRIVLAINEERLTRRKLEVGFPINSIKTCLSEAGLKPSDISEIAVSTSDPAKTLTRVFPNLKEEYYLIRRRKKRPSKSDSFKKRFKYRFTELSPNFVSKLISRISLKKSLNDCGFKNYSLTLPDHHMCHALTAACCSGFNESTVLTIDGLGDGLSGSLWKFEQGKLLPVKMFDASVSFGIFFEHVTNLMNMRELEDEGKVMALANYAYPIDDKSNPIMQLICTRGLDIVSPYSSNALYDKLKEILWQYPSEQFAYMAQRVLEKNLVELVKNAVNTTKLHSIALAGGVFSNIKTNMQIAHLPEIEHMFVFPHMGDGGLAIGAAMARNYEKYYIHKYDIPHIYTGIEPSKDEILAALQKFDFSYEEIPDVSKLASELILNGEIILWFQGKMELGPRALGNRSILARPDDLSVKDRLNLVLKKRVWYQPFCPSMLIEDASDILYAEKQHIDDNRFMTTGFKVRESYQKLLCGVTNIDKTCRPHFVKDENPKYRDLLLYLKHSLGKGVVLNTSFNIHGEPIVCTPYDALKMLALSDIRYLFIDRFVIKKQL